MHSWWISTFNALMVDIHWNQPACPHSCTCIPRAASTAGMCHCPLHPRARVTRHQVQQNALQQYERLEALTHKLDALNPEMRGPALEAIQGLRAKIAPHGVLPVYVSLSALLLPSVPHQLALYPSICMPTSNADPAAQGREAPASAQGTCTPSAAPADTSSSTAPASTADAPATTPKAQGTECDTQSQRQEGSSGATAAAAAANGSKGTDGGGAPAVRLSISRGRGRGRGRGLIAKGGNKSGGDGQWTGAGFDVEDESIA
ncbi:unnamed protein product [Closterium sp. NIES-54]